MKSVWIGLEGTFRGHLVPPPCHGRGYLQPDQVAESPVQPDFECFQDGQKTTGCVIPRPKRLSTNVYGLKLLSGWSALCCCVRHTGASHLILAKT